MGIHTDTPSVAPNTTEATGDSNWTPDWKPDPDVAEQNRSAPLFQLRPEPSRRRHTILAAYSLRQKLNRLQQEKYWGGAILDALVDSISVHDANFRILFQNRTHQEAEGNHVGGICYESFCHRNKPCNECPLRSMFRDGQIHSVNRSLNVHGTVRHFEVTVTPLRDQQNRIIAGIEVIRDVTERKCREEKLRFMSSHDVLTGLHNRLHFEEEVLRLSEAKQFPLSIIMADVDDLKRLNDSQGHAAGDQLLQQVAAIMRNSFRSADVIARIGGDEFAVILPCTDEQSTAEAIERLLRQLDDCDKGNGMGPRLSIGHGTARSGKELGVALLAADHCMYRDKMERTGRAPRERYHYGTAHHPD